LSTPVASQTASTLSLPGSTTADSGSYSVVVTGSCGGVTSTAFSLTINALPNATISGNPSLSIQGGQSTTLATGTNPTGTTYRWDDQSTNATRTVAPLQTTAYSVTVTTPSGCSAIGTATVSVSCVPVSAQASSAIPMANLGPGNCTVQVMSSGTGNAFVLTDATGQSVYSTVYRTGGSYSGIPFPVSKPGTYTFTAYYTNACGTVSQHSRMVTVGGTACN
jgi:hypothetical protein